MALVIIGKVEGMDAHTYDAINREMGFPDQKVPDGLLSHTSATENGGMLIIDVWESRQKFDTFVEEMLLPAMQKVGVPIPGDAAGPDQVLEVHFRWPG
jgi:hypothetical protein